MRITNHLTCKKCYIWKLNIDIIEFKHQLETFKEGFRLEMNRKHKAKSQAKLREERGAKIVQAAQNQQKAKSRTKLKEERGSNIVQAAQNQQKAKSRTKLKEERGKDTVQEDQNKQKAKSRLTLR